MAEYIEREALLACTIVMDGHRVVPWVDVLAVPAADVVEVVRCRDCEHHKGTSVKEYEHCCLTGLTVGMDDFCSYGERRESDG